MRSKPRSRRTLWQTLAVSLWALLCLSLASWWMIFSLKQLELLKSSQIQGAERLANQQSMLIQEGIFLFVLLLLGAVALFYYILREKRRSQHIREFFAVFTHEVKTSLASLRLQVESLEEDLRGESSPHHNLTQRLVKDTVRLELQLENSLLFSNIENQDLFLEEVDLKEFLESSRYQWPEMEFQISGQCRIFCDRRLLEILFKNLFHNAYKHGKASIITVKIEAHEEFCNVQVSDNGSGFSGDESRRGKIFFRHQAQSGSGLGLYLVENIVSRLGGNVGYPKIPQGFAVEIGLSRRLKR